MKPSASTLTKWSFILLGVSGLCSCTTPPSTALVEAVLAGDEQRIARVAAEEAFVPSFPRSCKIFRTWCRL